MTIELPSRFEDGLQKISDEYLKVRGMSRQDLREHMERRVLRDANSPQVGETAPEFELEILSPQGKRAGETLKLSSFWQKLLGLIFGSYT